MTLYILENVATFRGMNVSNGEIDYDAYDEVLDAGGAVWVAGCAFYPSQILKLMDPIAYHCGYTDWKDSYQCDLEDAILLEDYSEIVWIEDPEEKTL